MSTATNKAAYERFYTELINRGNTAVVDELVDADIISHAPMPGQAPGVEGLKQTIMIFRQAFPDLHAAAEDIIAEGDRVVGRFTVTGTHKGAFMGLPASGNRIQYDEIVIVRFRDGRIVEHWAVADSLALMQQIGALPA